MEKPQSYGRLINVIRRKSFAEEARAADRWILNERSTDNEGPAVLEEISDVSFNLVPYRIFLISISGHVKDTIIRGQNSHDIRQ